MTCRSNFAPFRIAHGTMFQSFGVCSALTSPEQSGTVASKSWRSGCRRLLTWEGRTDPWLLRILEDESLRALQRMDTPYIPLSIFVANSYKFPLHQLIQLAGLNTWKSGKASTSQCGWLIRDQFSRTFFDSLISVYLACQRVGDWTAIPIKTWKKTDICLFRIFFLFISFRTLLGRGLCTFGPGAFCEYCTSPQWRSTRKAWKTILTQGTCFCKWRERSEWCCLLVLVWLCLVLPQSVSHRSLFHGSHTCSSRLQTHHVDRVLLGHNAGAGLRGGRHSFCRLSLRKSLSNVVHDLPSAASCKSNSQLQDSWEKLDVHRVLSSMKLESSVSFWKEQSG